MCTRFPSDSLSVGGSSGPEPWLTVARAQLTVLETFPVSGMGPVLPRLPGTGPATLMSGFLCYLNHAVSAAALRAEPSAGLKVEDRNLPP